MKAVVALVACAIVLISAFMVGAKADVSLSTALVHQRQYYESTLDKAAQAVLRKLNKENEITKGSRVSKLDLDEIKVAESILYSVGLEMDIGNLRGLTYELQFVQPLAEWLPVRMASALPGSAPTLTATPRMSTALALQGSVPTYAPPEIALTLRGPLELFFPDPLTELIVKTPRITDLGFVDRLVIKEGTAVTLIGAVEMRLRDTIAIDASVTIDNDRLIVYARDKPKVNVYGRRIEVTNATESDQLRVQKKYATVVEVASADAAEAPARVPFEIPLNNSRMGPIRHALEQLANAANTSFPTNIRRLSSGSRMEAVIGFVIPLEIEDAAAGTASSWDVIAVQGSNHKEAQVISVARQQVRNEVAYAQALVLNGTLPDAMENFQLYLQSTGQTWY